VQDDGRDATRPVGADDRARLFEDTSGAELPDDVERLN